MDFSMNIHGLEVLIKLRWGFVFLNRLFAIANRNMI